MKIYIAKEPCRCSMDCTGWHIEMVFEDEEEAKHYVAINYGTSYGEYEIVPK